MIEADLFFHGYQAGVCACVRAPVDGRRGEGVQVWVRPPVEWGPKAAVGGQGCIGKGGGVPPPPPPSRAPSLCPATVSLTASASFDGVRNRQ